jgi:hypothetical protein
MINGGSVDRDAIDAELHDRIGVSATLYLPIGTIAACINPNRPPNIAIA